MGLAAGCSADTRGACQSVRLEADRRQALPAAPVEAGRAETIRLIPYGCTKFRISMFPVTPQVLASTRLTQVMLLAFTTPSYAQERSDTLE